jgi:DNA-binding PadR family transcriptional regulator
VPRDARARAKPEEVTVLLRYAILSLLEAEEMHGYRIKAAFERRLGPFWTVNFGQIYETLKALRRRALIAGRLDRERSHLGRWVYGITPKGRRALDTWLSRAPARPQPARHEILVRLFRLAHGSPEACLEQLARQERVYAGVLEEWRAQGLGRPERDPAACLDAAALVHRMAVDATVSQVEAHLRWLRRCADLLRARSGSPTDGKETGNGAPASGAPETGAAPSLASTIAGARRGPRAARDRGRTNAGR